MPLDLDKFKGKTLEGEMLSELQAAVSAQLEAEVTPWRDKAKKAERESIEGRKAKDARIERLSELLGVEPDADLDKIDVKGQAEAAKQFEARLKRAERELADERKAHGELQGRFKTERRERAIREQLARIGVNDEEVAYAVATQRVREDGDELMFDVGDGKLSPLDVGLPGYFKTKPGLLKPVGTGGTSSGYTGGASGGKTLSQAEFSSLRPAERAQRIADGYTLQEAA